MKKNILAIAIASVVATPVAFANAPTVYGQFNMALEDVSKRGNDVTHRNSRVGIKGSEDLGNGLKAIYQAEGTIGNGTNFSGNDFGFDRNTFAGLSGGFGTVVMGRHDTPLRMIQPNDGFADSLVGGNNTSNFTGLNSNGNVVGGNTRLQSAGNVNANGIGSGSGEHRLNNVLAYISPSFNGIQFAVAGSSNTNVANGALNNRNANTLINNTVVGLPNTTTDVITSSIANAYSASLTYGSKSEGLFAGLGMTHVGEAQKGLKNEQTNLRAVVQWNKNGLLLNAMYNELQLGSGTDRVDATGTIFNRNFQEGQVITLGAAYKFGAFTPRAKVAMVSYKNAFDEVARKLTATDWSKDSMSVALGLDYSLGKNTKVYAEYAVLDKNNRAMTTNAQSLLQANKRTDTTAVSVGFFHKF